MFLPSLEWRNCAHAHSFNWQRSSSGITSHQACGHGHASSLLMEQNGCNCTHNPCRVHDGVDESCPGGRRRGLSHSKITGASSPAANGDNGEVREIKHESGSISPQQQQQQKQHCTKLQELSETKLPHMHKRHLLENSYTKSQTFSSYNINKLLSFRSRQRQHGWKGLGGHWHRAVSVRLNKRGRRTVRGSEDESASVRPTTLP